MEYIYYGVLFIMGLVLGSFYCCMGYRIPNKISVYKKGSFCPQCKKPLKWYMNIPLISYIIQFGKCSYCKKKISIVYPLCEILTALLFIISYYLLGFSMEFYISLILISALIVTLVSDFLYYYVSDRVMVISILLILIIIYVFYGLKYSLVSLLSGMIMLMIMLIIKLIGNVIFKKESMGNGDIKLMGLIGTAIGIVNSFFALFLASVIAMIYVVITKKIKTGNIIPFAPYLLLGALLTIFFNSYINLFINYLLYQ